MWYSENLSLWIGILSIGIIALLLALLTLLILKRASKGKWKKTIFTIQKLSIFLGIIVLVVGIVALVVKQEFHVWYPLCMVGIMLIFIMTPQLLIVSRIYSSIAKKEVKTDDTNENAMTKKQKTDEKHLAHENKEKASKNESIYSSISEEDSSKNI